MNRNKLHFAQFQLVLLSMFFCVAAHGESALSPAAPDSAVKKLAKASSNRHEASALVHEIYQWAGASLQSASCDQIIEALKPSLRIIPNSVTTSLKKRRDYQLPDPKTTAPYATIAWWERASSAEFVIQIDYWSTILKPDSFFQSEPPMIFARHGGKIYSKDLASWKYAELVFFTYTVHGVVPGPGAEDFPDVLISAGQFGSGNFVYLVQLHFDAKTNEWSEVWNTFYSYVIDVKMQPKKKMLQIEYRRDKEQEQADIDTLDLGWGTEAHAKK